MSKTLHSKRYEAFRDILVEQRKKAGLTQADVAKKLGKPQSFISKYEKGERRLDVIEFIEIAEVIGFNPATILKGL